MAKYRSALFWSIASVGVLFLATLPVSHDAQLAAAGMAFAALLLLKLKKPDGVLRLVALALGTAIVIRYFWWRTTETIPPVTQPENFVPGLLLYIAELYNLLMLALTVFVVASPLRRPDLPEQTVFPSVDILVPSYDEPAELLAVTLSAAKRLNYPADKLKVWLLDDGGTDQKCQSSDPAAARSAIERRATLQALCQELGVNYLTRERNERAKAGNLNNGLAYSSGELVAVFDADHVPTRDFLTETVGHFVGNEKLFLVQTPHFFTNPDPLERNLDTYARMPSENEMFYGIVQRGLDKWNGSFFCGSAAVLRRAALDVTGGFAGVSITEDCETALELHARGWESCFVDKPLVGGLQPTTFASFIQQRTRWAQGMMQILCFKFPPLKRGLSLPQRLCYMSSIFFWLFPFSRVAFLLAPLFYIFFGREIFIASGIEFFCYTIMYFATNLIMQNYLYGRYRWPWISEMYELIQSVYLLPATLSVLVRRKSLAFKVTAKDEECSESYISELGWPFYLIFAVLLAGVGFSLWDIISGADRSDIAVVVGGWNLLNLLMVGCALGVVTERPIPQGGHRVKIERLCRLVQRGGKSAAVVENMSATRASLRVRINEVGRLTKNESIAVMFASATGAGTLNLRVNSTRRIGSFLRIECTVAPTSAADFASVADLMYADSKRWSAFQESRRANVGVVSGSLWFLRLAIRGTLIGLASPLKTAWRSASRTPRPQTQPTPQAQEVRLAAPDLLVGQVARR